MVCYVGSHYISFFYSMRRNAWIEFDDSTIITIYDWNEVVGKIVKGKMFPVLIFYELDSALDAFKRQFQLEYIENDTLNYLLDPEVYFESFTDMMSMDLAGLVWKSDLIDIAESKKCTLF